MEMLDHEKFEGIKELAEITQGISKGRALLATLKEEEEAYIAERETRVVQRLQDALAASEDLIKQIGTNHSELVGYRSEVDSFVDTLGCLIQSVRDCVNVLHQATDALEQRVADHEKAAATFKEESKQQVALIEGKRAGMAMERKKLNEDQLKVADDSGRLERAFARIKS